MHQLKFVGHFWKVSLSKPHYLGGGFKYFLFSPLPGEMIQFDSYFSNGLKPPTSYSLPRLVGSDWGISSDWTVKWFVRWFLRRKIALLRLEPRAFKHPVFRLTRATFIRSYLLPRKSLKKLGGEFSPQCFKKKIIPIFQGSLKETTIFCGDQS